MNLFMQPNRMNYNVYLFYLFRNKPKMAYSQDVFTRDQQETRERQD